ncbi:uncharacterized protein FIBRA_00775 [Fibroporia radiculosa]|uniref:Uncharacterized protein n=1 Tax=Fibroporia radiculosa TaxID=599839 RepID=J4GIK1_9APHY|nr:uncharacterized protein FIBRA_00775 [Fibroporia radiculosa]CCL98770.1 predicted protein [Fibroporia radiculosa]
MVARAQSATEQRRPRLAVFLLVHARLLSKTLSRTQLALYIVHMDATAALDESAELSLQTPESSSSSLSASADSSVSESTSTSLSATTHLSILRTSASFSSVSQSNITFAPLPTIEPRRRKSNVQLGVAARSRLLQQRRNLRDQGIHPGVAHLHSPSDLPPPVPVWHSELDDDYSGDDVEDLGPDPAEEAIAAIGRLVKGASRSLWRRLASKDAARKDRSSSTDETQPITEKGPPSGSSSPDRATASAADTAAQEPQEGRVWEEEVDVGRWQRQGADPAPTPESGLTAEISSAGRRSRRVSTIEALGIKKSKTTAR